MSYIIIQFDLLGRFEEMDVMINEEGSALKTFQTEEDAQLFLYRHGLEGFKNSFPHQIRVARLQ